MGRDPGGWGVGIGGGKWNLDLAPPALAQKQKSACDSGALGVGFGHLGATGGGQFLTVVLVPVA